MIGLLLRLLAGQAQKPIQQARQFDGSAFLNKVRQFIDTPRRKEAEFRQNNLENDPNYQRYQYDQYERNNPYRRVDYGTNYVPPKPSSYAPAKPKTPKYM
ncbi:MAG: hypothetical protein H0U60_19945 [Blastocatellia bacterium]|nr:hypothetical protein [Blastocatellia bacterium]